MMYTYLKFYHSRSIQVWETEFSLPGKHKSVYVQKSVKSRSSSENDIDTTEIIL